MNWLTGLALKRRSVVLLAVVLVVLVGSFGITRLQTGLIPNLDIPVLTVITLVLVGILFVGSLGLIPLIGTSFISSGGEKIVAVQADMPSGTARDITEQRAEQFEQVIRDNPDVDLLQTQIGGDSLEAAFTGAANDRATITVNLNKAANLNDTMEMLRQKLGDVAGNAAITVSDQSGGFGSGNLVQVIVKGPTTARSATRPKR